ncbi:FCD domain-containing protein, partial [Thioclava sp. BHET1]
LHMMRAMFDLLRQGVFYNRQILFRRHTTRSALLEQHRAIHAAIQARDPDTARAAVEIHLDYVETDLRAQHRADAQEAVARQRYEQERGR